IDLRPKKSTGQSPSKQADADPDVQANKKDDPAIVPKPSPGPEEKKKGPPDTKGQAPDLQPAAKQGPPIPAINPPPPGEGKVRHSGGVAPGASASLAPDGQLLVIAGPGRDLVLVDMNTNKERKLASRDRNIHQAIFVRGGKQVLAAAREPKGALSLFD